MAKPTISPPRTPAALTSDEAYAYTSRLRLDPRTANPDDWRVDWHDGPWPVKVYTGGQRIRLRPGGAPLVAALHRVLYDGFAIRRVRADPSGGVHATPGDPRPHHGPQVLLRRPIPSGGSMYPTEVYAVLLTGADQVCHYDPYRHELTVLGDAHAVVPALRGALGPPGAAGAQEALAPVLLVLTSRFWKNFYKYGDFSARLGTVDAGVAVGRAVRLARAGFGHAEVRTAFDDAALNACLGLDGTEESAYAVVGLGHPVRTEFGTGTGTGGRPPAVLERSRTIRRSARFDAWQRATRTAGSDAGSGFGARSVSDPADAVKLPAPRRPDLLAPRVIAQRASRGRLFTGAEVDAERLATVLEHTAEALRELARDCPDGLGARAAETELYCSPHRVSGVPAGWYRYLPDRGALLPAGTGADPHGARQVQEALFAASFNAELAAFTVHVVTPLDWRRRGGGGGGARGYREQQLAVGAAVEAVTLCASAEELSGHAVLGFDVTRMDRAYGLEGSGRGTQAQVCVGALRADPNWEIAVMPR
nr:hypothetical protein OH820_21110 [Streptomyces sp. NBC_00857]